MTTTVYLPFASKIKNWSVHNGQHVQKGECLGYVYHCKADNCIDPSSMAVKIESPVTGRINILFRNGSFISADETLATIDDAVQWPNYKTNHLHQQPQHPQRLQS